MKLAVTRCDGDTEIIILNDPVQVFEGTHQAHIHSAEGMDHYFRLSDGKYDGYGRSAPDQGWTSNQAATYLEQMDSERRIIPVTIRGILWERLKRVRWFLVWRYNHLLGRKGF